MSVKSTINAIAIWYMLLLGIISKKPSCEKSGYVLGIFYC